MERVVHTNRTNSFGIAIKLSLPVLLEHPTYVMGVFFELHAEIACHLAHVSQEKILDTLTLLY